MDKTFEAQRKKVAQTRIWVTGGFCPPETSAHTFIEALAVQAELDQRRPEYKWHVEDGPKNWKTNKPSCYLIKSTPKES